MQISENIVTLRTKRVQMEEVKRYSIAYKGLADGEHRFTFEVDKTLFEGFGNEEIRDCRCTAEVDMLRSQTMLEIAVAINGSVTVACDRCLDDCLVPIEYNGSFVVRFADEDIESDDEIMWLSTAETEVDLTQYIYDSIVLSLPYQRVHAEGECNPEMLKYFRVVSPDEFAKIEAEASKDEEESLAPSEIEKLKALKEAMESDKKR